MPGTGIFVEPGTDNPPDVGTRENVVRIASRVSYVRGTDEQNRDMAASMAGNKHGLKCIAIVHEKEGAETERFHEFLTGMVLILTDRFVIKLFSDIPSALYWMADHVPIPSIERTLVVVNGVRERLLAAPPAARIE